jgi:predicted N-acetyltransferase YhbS
MDFRLDERESADEIESLFTATFTASEGPEEGRLVGKLARDLLATTPQEDLFVVSAREDGGLLGCIFFSRLVFEGDDRAVFVLGPVAVATERQGEGIGQRLLRHGLDQLRGRGVDVAVTYGDPNYYSKVGFLPIAEDEIPAPFRLAHPEGWLGQSLTDRPLGAIEGPSRCVEALNRPEFW